jgi:hypothetical protein
MSKQIFKELVPKEILFDLLDKICERVENGDYLVNNAAYKRMKFHNYHPGFLASIIDYYHWSKRFYVERDFTYQSFINIVRQITRIHGIRMTSNTKYLESSYMIEYIIGGTEGSPNPLLFNLR